MTNTKQRQSLTLPDSGDSDWKKADKRFLWNYHMGSSLLNLANSGDRNKVAPFLVLLIHGGVYIHRCSINGVRIFIKISNFHFNIQFLMCFLFFRYCDAIFRFHCSAHRAEKGNFLGMYHFQCWNCHNIFYP